MLESKYKDVDKKLLNQLEVIKRQYLVQFLCDGFLDETYINLYNDFPAFLRSYFSTFHSFILSGLQDLKTANRTYDSIDVYLHAEFNKKLISAIDANKALTNALKDTEYAFIIDENYKVFLDFIRPSLAYSGGSNVKIDSCWDNLVPYYTLAIFRRANTIEIKRDNAIVFTSKQYIGSGSYATVSKFKDDFYDEWYAIKELKPDANEKDWKRFKAEFKILKEINSPYIVHVYKFDEDKRSYIMDMMDGTIEDLCQQKELQLGTRINIALQIIRGIRAIHEKGICHRDISPCNILYKEYDDTFIVKISDFGLVKDPNNRMTSASSDSKGRFIDPEVEQIGFDKFEKKHDLYPLAKTLIFVVLGKYSCYEKYPKLVELENNTLTHIFETVNEVEVFFKREVIPSIKMAYKI